MDNNLLIRTIAEADTEEVLAIYAPYITSSAATFEYEVPSIAEFRARITELTANYPWLVCVVDGKVIGYAYASKHRYRAAYDWCVESTIYVAPAYHGKGIARLLYETLFAALRLQGYVNVYAGVTLPNAGSEALHRAMGFGEIGIFKNIGYKFGRWHDVKWFQLALTAHIADPPVPKPINMIHSAFPRDLFLNT